MNIIFICRYNRFRSKIAEAFFNKLNRNKNHKAKSAGIIRGNPISEEIIESAKNFGLSIKSKPMGLTTKMLKWHDMAIIVANDVPEIILHDSKKYGKKVIVWEIPDADDGKKAEMEKTILQIEAKVKNLVNELD